MKVTYVNKLIVSVVCFGLSSFVCTQDASKSVTVSFPILKEQAEPTLAKDEVVQDVVQDVVEKEDLAIKVEKIETPLVDNAEVAQEKEPETFKVEIPEPAPVVSDVKAEVPVKVDQVDKEKQAFEEYDELCAQMPAREPSTLERIASGLLLSYDLTKDFMHKKYLAIKYLVASWLSKDKAEVVDEQPQA